MTTIVWFRQDLRLADNRALSKAAARGTVLPVFILDEVHPGRWQLGGASRWWLHHSLAALGKSLGSLVLLRGDPLELLPRLAKESGATAVHWNRCYEPFAIARDKQLKERLKDASIAAESFNGSLLNEPWEIANGDGGPFKVFTPFWRACQKREIERPLPAPKLRTVASKTKGDTLRRWGLLPGKPDWAAHWTELWQPGEAGALARLAAFATNGLAGYAERRDRPDLAHVSRLSPHLHWGEVSPRTVAARVRHASDAGEVPQNDVAKLMSELGWREFAYHLLYYFPTLPERNWRQAFDAYPWADAPDHLRAWQRGRTGYPMVDAGMRELWQTGFMHNRVRMVTASFLIKHLRIDWQQGEAWFWDTLVDADLANNAAGWQWVAGSGADAAPYFRVFNPVTQGIKFDSNGDYVRRWCPELAKLPNEHIHAPFLAPPVVLGMAGVELGRTYPHPIVDHAQARAAALDGYKAVKAAGDTP